MDIVFVKPKKFEEIIKYMEYVSNDVILHINVNELSEELSQRVVDFVSGAAYTKEAVILTPGDGIFCVLPQVKEYKMEYKSNVSSIIDTRDNEEEEIRPSR